MKSATVKITSQGTKYVDIELLRGHKKVMDTLARATTLARARKLRLPGPTRNGGPREASRADQGRE